nr:LysR family transcriptional regulator [uncultured Romboutsia sp.]
MFEELKTFITVVEHKNFTKAGEYLNLSQPSVSTHIKNLESYYGVTLINRSIKHKSIIITENGYKLYNRAKEILHILDTTYMEVRDISDSIKGIIKVGASLTIGEYILPKFLTIFRKKYPDIEVDLLIDNTALITENLKDLTLDIGFIEGISSYHNLNQEYLSEDKMVLAVPYGFHLIDNKFTFDLLQNQNWVAREEGSGTREYLNLFLNSNKIVPKNLMVLGSNYAVKEAVRNGLGITIISNFVAAPAAKNKELIAIELDKSYNRSFSYILPKNINVTKATEIFLEEFKNYLLTITK